MNQAAKLRFMMGGTPNMPLVLRMASGGGLRLGAQHSQSLEALFAHIPGLVVVMPSNPFDAKGLLTAAIQDDNPVIFLEQKLLFFGDPVPVPEERYAIELGRASVVRAGTDVTVVALGATVTHALRVARELEDEGVSVEVVDPRTLVPLDTDTIAASVAKTHRVVVAHEAVQFCGFGSEIAAHIGEHCFWELDAPVVRVGAPSHPMPYQKDLELATLPGPAEITAAVRSLLPGVGLLPQREQRDPGDDEHRAGEPRPAHALVQHDGRKDGGHHDARLAHRGDRRGRGALERGQDERVGGEGGEAREDGRGAELGPHPRAPLDGQGRPRVPERRRDHAQLQVGDRARVRDPSLVEERVGGDHAADPQRERERVRVGGRPEAADEEHAGTDQRDTGDLRRRAPLPEHHDRDHEHDRRCDPTRHRVDERQLGLAIGGREEREVEELQHRGHDDERPHGPLGVEAQGRDRGEDDHRGDERDRRRALGIAGPREEDVPERVQDGGSERERERQGWHRASESRLPGRMGTARALMFDFNGTLSHDEPLLLAIYQRLFARQGRPLTEEQYFEQLAGLSEEAIIGSWLGVTGAPLEALMAERIESYVAAADGSTVTEAVRAAVRHAAERVPVAIVSGAYRAEIVPVVEAAGLATELTAIITADDVAHGKPHPEGYLLALERLGVEASEAVALEDTEAGVASAKAAGLHCVAVRGTLPDVRLQQADELVDGIDVALVRRLVGS